MKYAWLPAALLVVTTSAYAQKAAPGEGEHASTAPVAVDGAVGTSGVIPSQPTFRSGVDLVALNVVVTDSNKRFVEGLGQNDFAVFEDGVRQDVSFFAASNVPLDLAILLDTSASMTDKMVTMQKAAIGFLGTLRPGDRAMVVDIKDATRVIHALTGPTDDVTAAVKSTRASGGTGLFNGLYLTFRELVKARGSAGGDLRRQAIVVLSDGQDTSSLMSFDDVMDVAKQSGIATYTITLRSPVLSAVEQQHGGRYFSASEFSMRSLATETGGQAFFPLEIAELDQVYGSIAKELASQYAIGYTPKAVRQDTRFRRIIVQVTDRPEMRIRTRSGYTPKRSASSLE